MPWVAGLFETFHDRNQCFVRGTWRHTASTNCAKGRTCERRVLRQLWARKKSVECQIKRKKKLMMIFSIYIYKSIYCIYLFYIYYIFSIYIYGICLACALWSNLDWIHRWLSLRHFGWGGTPKARQGTTSSTTAREVARRLRSCSSFQLWQWVKESEMETMS
jgi:hypothetical protein